MTEPKNRLFVALDVDHAEKAFELASTLSVCTRRFKIGSRLFTAAGPEVVKRIIATGAEVFLDLKFHDIPNTVSAAAAAATRLGVYMFNLHASGGREMIRRAVESSSKEAARLGQGRPLILGVTVLTSTDANALQDAGVVRSMEEQVVNLSNMSAECGLDGVVASPREARLIRGAVHREGFLIVTPGIRPANGPIDDQKRIMTPREAIREGADFIVVGRPITDAPNPVDACRRVISEIEAVLD